MHSLKYLVYVALGLVLLMVIYYVIRTTVLLHQTTLLDKNSHPYEQSPSNSEAIILVVGDSTAVGTGSNTPKESIAGRLGSLFPSATIINEGINGQKISELRTSFNSHNVSKADLIIIQIGANDIVQFTSPQAAEKDLALLLEKAQKISPQIVVLHGGCIGNAPLFPLWLSFIWNNRTSSFRKFYMMDVPKYGGVYVDLYKKRKDDIFLTDPKKYYASDMFHPSSDGYKLWFDEMIIALHKRYGNDFLK